MRRTSRETRNAVPSAGWRRGPVGIGNRIKGIKALNPVKSERLERLADPADPLQRWTHGRLTLLGDAAHAMLPHMGQGANQAIEDGMALATLMRGAGAADVTDVLIRYQALRPDRTARVQQGSRANGMRMDSGQAITIGQPGVQDYDVEAEARAMR